MSTITHATKSLIPYDPTNLITFTIPDIIGHCPFPIRVNPYYAAASAESDAWFDSFEVHDEARRNAFYSHKFGLLVAMICPEADYEALRNCCDFMSMLYAFDDLTDDGGLRGSVQGARNAADQVMLALKNPSSAKLDFKVAAILRDIWLRISARASEGAQRRFIQTTQSYVDAAFQQVVNRVDDQIFTIDEFIRLRRDLSAVDMLLALFEYCMNLTLPDFVFDDPVVKALQLAANDILTWANDVYSYNKEQARGDTQNLVISAMHELSLDIQGAVNHVSKMVTDRIDEYVECKRLLPSWGPEIDRQVAVYVTGLEDHVMGCLHWSFDCERYFGKQHAEVKRHLTVTLLPVDLSLLPGVDSVTVNAAHPHDSDGLAQTMNLSLSLPAA